jgi:hypothetical protein
MNITADTVLNLIAVTGVGIICQILNTMRNLQKEEREERKDLDKRVTELLKDMDVKLEKKLDSVDCDKVVADCKVDRREQCGRVGERLAEMDKKLLCHFHATDGSVSFKIK